MSFERVCVSHHYACDCRERYFKDVENKLFAKQNELEKLVNLYQQKVKECEQLKSQLGELV